LASGSFIRAGETVEIVYLSVDSITKFENPCGRLLGEAWLSIVNLSLRFFSPPSLELAEIMSRSLVISVLYLVAEGIYLTVMN
jgi:hypothetical protein